MPCDCVSNVPVQPFRLRWVRYTPVAIAAPAPQINIVSAISVTTISSSYLSNVA